MTDLLHDAKLPTVNCVVAREAGMAAWSTLSPYRAGSPLTPIFRGLEPDNRTRGAANGDLRLPSDHRNVLIRNAVTIWNVFPSLREAKSPSMARSHIRGKIWKKLPL